MGGGGRESPGIFTGFPSLAHGGQTLKMPPSNSIVLIDPLMGLPQTSHFSAKIDRLSDECNLNIFSL